MTISSKENQRAKIGGSLSPQVHEYPGFQRTGDGYYDTRIVGRPARKASGLLRIALRHHLHKHLQPKLHLTSATSARPQPTLILDNSLAENWPSNTVRFGRGSDRVPGSGPEKLAENERQARILIAS